MDLNAIMGFVNDFLKTDFGRMIFDGLMAIYHALFPANAPGADVVPLPEPKKPGA
ncbi:MAG TPA: hypothetical protein H9867_06855 [Candidatus Corynebacterium gallistercoris]|uniref:Uncharacterized protein n=1 Tax=Candidatus Corynebacterium gallistercoris TaxID=2838530 RepID=A0A9D1RXX6_9CORY|nr:hypothetical protein [Candidatus Corynebacterium gallistercoris]